MKGSRSRAVVALLTAAVLATACGSNGSGGSGSTPTPAPTAATPTGDPGGGDTTPPDDDAPAEVSRIRLGIFPNVTHAPGLAALERGFLQEALGEDVTIEVHHFNAGGQAVQALFSDALDITYIGPNPAINGFAQSEGQAVRLIAGSTSGGAFLIVRDGIETIEDLAGTTIATPALGNTQDVAIRAWLADHGYETDLTGGGDVVIANLANPDILQGFILGELDGAWVPEPWATRLILEGEGNVFLDEADLWPNGQYVTTHVLVSTDFLEANPIAVRRFLQGHLNAVEFVNGDAAEAQEVVLDALEEITGERLAENIIQSAWDNLEFTWDPVASSLAKSAADAIAADLLDPVDLDGIYDLTILNELLRERGEAEVAGL